jgi:NAD(P)-dependent dehydrogenase (short-subunit alcohol dehydrogenase family)
MIGIAGGQSSIAREFIALLPDGEEPYVDRLNEMPFDLDRYLICTGFLAGKAISCIDPEEANLTWRKNFVDIARFCDRLFIVNPRARVCVIGSESGFEGSFDMAYAGAKAALHLYVETKRLKSPEQQLLAIAPCIISDSNMTQRRNDLRACEARGAATRHERWLTAREVAVQAHQALFIASCFLSNTVIRMRGERP